LHYAIKYKSDGNERRGLAKVTEQIEAYKTVIPGRTRDPDVSRYSRMRMVELRVESAWAPDQNPNVNSGIDRGHPHATEKII